MCPAHLVLDLSLSVLYFNVIVNDTVDYGFQLFINILKYSLLILCNFAKLI